MRNMGTRKKHKSQLSAKDIQLLYMIYQLRAVTYEQFKKLGNYTSKFYYYHKVQKFVRLGLIYKETITGSYQEGKRHQGNYVGITESGLSLLKEKDYKISHTAYNSRVNKKRLAYTLTANDLIIKMLRKGWSFREAREIKEEHDIHRGNTFQGVLTSPNKEDSYLLYALLHRVQGQTVDRIKYELTTQHKITDVLITTKGQDGFKTVVNSVTNERHPLITGGKALVLPHAFSAEYLTIFDGNVRKYEDFLKTYDIELLCKSPVEDSSENIFGSNVKCDYQIRYNGEEYYFVDMLGNDMMKLRDVREYKREDYKRDGRKMLVLTSAAGFHKEKQQEILGVMPHVEFLELNFSNMIKNVRYINKLFDKR